MSRPFENKVVAISGAGKGLGRAYALHLARLGARVVVNNRRHPGEALSSADEVVSEIRADGGAAVAEYSSVEEPDAGERLLETALGQFGRLDAVVANAGVAESRSFHKQELAEFRRVIEINLLGTAHILHPAFRHMYRHQGGTMIVSSSVAGLYGEHGLPAYSASKAALLGLMHSLNSEGARHGIRINALAPFASTQMTEKSLPPTLRARLEADRVAPVLAWLISDQCTLSGEIVICGGGKIARARVMETKACSVPSGREQNVAALNGLWEQIQLLPLDRAYAGALEQFGEFTGD